MKLDPGVSIEVAPNLFIENVEIGLLKEQDVNAHTMSPSMLQRLTENIRRTGRLESLPYCAQPDRSKPIEIVSGHHRIRAARAAGLTHVVVLVDRAPLTRSQVIAKQLAHNALVGNDDPDLVRKLIAQMSDVDSLLESGLSEEYLPTPDQFKVTLFTPHADYKWKFCVFTFLSHQLEDAKQLVKEVNAKCDLMLVADEAQFQDFINVVAEFARRKEILSAGTAVAHLIQIAKDELARMDVAEAKKKLNAAARERQAVREAEEGHGPEEVPYTTTGVDAHADEPVALP